MIYHENIFKIDGYCFLMKVSSVSMETEVEISLEEAKKLEKKSLEGVLRFYDHEISLKRAIPFKIRLRPKQKDLLVVRKNPRDNYFGYAKRVKFLINQEFYSILIENGSFGDRFYGSGKLIIKIMN